METSAKERSFFELHAIDINIWGTVICTKKWYLYKSEQHYITIIYHFMNTIVKRAVNQLCSKAYVIHTSYGSDRSYQVDSKQK